MIKCDNCEEAAAYTQADPGVNSVNYCQRCLPYWLQKRAIAGHFPLVEPVAPEESDATVESKSKKKTSTSENN